MIGFFTAKFLNVVPLLSEVTVFERIVTTGRLYTQNPDMVLRSWVKMEGKDIMCTNLPMSFSLGFPRVRSHTVGDTGPTASLVKVGNRIVLPLPLL